MKILVLLIMYELLEWNSCEWNGISLCGVYVEYEHSWNSW